MEEELHNGDDLFNELDTQEKDTLTPVQEEKTPEEDRSTDSYFEDVEEENVNQKEEKKDDLFKEEDAYDEEDLLIEDPVDDPVISFLRDRGFIDIEEGEDYSQYQGDDLNLYIENKINASIDNRIQSTIDQLPDVVRELNQYVLSGGDPKDFFSKISQLNSTGITENLDITDPQTQEYVVRNALANQGYDDVFINAQIEFLRTSNNLENHATNYYNQYMQVRQQEVQRMAEEQYYAQQEQQRQMQAQRQQLDNYIQNLDSAYSYPLSMRDKQELSSYIMDSAYTLEDGSTITQLQKDLFVDLQQDPEASIFLALLFKNRNADGSFNLSHLEKRAKSAVTKKVRDNLSRVERGTPNTNGMQSQASYKKKSLADYF